MIYLENNFQWYIFLTYIIYFIAKINIKDFHKLRAWCLFVNETTFTL
jgi:hypothetical protein